MPPDPDDCDAHHIVPKNEARPWAVKDARVARAALEGCVEIDSPENGVFLPRSQIGSKQCKGLHHRTLHTKEYCRNIAQRLSLALNSGGCEKVKHTLRIIKQQLISGAM